MQVGVGTTFTGELRLVGSNRSRAKAGPRIGGPSGRPSLRHVAHSP
jgi:hypothetical protein